MRVFFDFNYYFIAVCQQRIWVLIETYRSSDIFFVKWVPNIVLIFNVETNRGDEK